MASYKLNYPKTLPPNTITLRIRASTYKLDLGEHKHLVGATLE